MHADLVEWLEPNPSTARHVLSRAIAAALTAFVLGLLAGPPVLRLLRRMKLRERTGKSASETLNQLSRDKDLTPTMGGLMLIPPLLVAVLLWGNFDNAYVRLAFLGTAGFCLIGVIDDYIKMRYPDRRGMTSIAKLVLQSLVSGALAFALWLVMRARGDTGLDHNPLLELTVPFLGWSVALGGLGFLAVSAFIMVATSNGVNLTDGMDGLAPGSVMIAALALAAIAFAVGRPDYAESLSILHVAGAQEMVVIASALVGSVAAFLWYNAFPAQVFLGDTGSLPLGGLLGYIAVVSKQELVLPIVGGVFVAEGLSVILQVGSFKLRGKRIFRCAPVHHHFQFAGMHEAKIVVRFWLVGAACALVGLATLKFR